MLKLPKRFLITAALPYANGPLHIGHLAGAYLPADIYVRFLRLNGKEALFVCGSDEHSTEWQKNFEAVITAVEKTLEEE